MNINKTRIFSRKLTRPLLIASLTFCAFNVHAATELTVYTALEANDLEKYAERFNEDYPDIEIKWVRDSTGIITAKLLAEKENTRADVIWGVAATSLLLLESKGMLMPYMPEGAEKLRKDFIGKNDPPSWIGMNSWTSALCVNKYELKANDLPMPTSWEDLLDPVYKGHVIMPNPASSGTGYLDVSAWLQIFGEEDGWAYMDGLHENINRYTHSGSKPCKLAASGEITIGISMAYRAARLKERGAPLEAIIPSEGVGWEIEAAGIVKGTEQLEAAKQLMDWAVGEKANKLYAEGFSVVAMPGVSAEDEYLPAELEERMIDNDLYWAAENRAAILDEWNARYSVKSEPQ